MAPAETETVPSATPGKTGNAGTGAPAARGDRTKLAILEAAQATLQREGFANLSTRKVAAGAEVPLSLPRYVTGKSSRRYLSR